MTALKIRIEPANARDVERLVALSAELGYAIEARDLGQQLELLMSIPGHQVLVARSAGEPAGWVHVFLSRRLMTADFAEVGALIVGGGYRRQGIGAQLVAAAEDWARSEGLGSLRIRSNRQRSAALDFYLACDYRIEKEQNIFVKELE